MLVVSRKHQESIDFPDLGIRITIVRIEKGRVRVGIDAPKDIKILRSELPPKSRKDDATPINK